MISSIPELLRGHLGQPTPFCYWGGPPINVQSLSSLHSCLRRRRRVTTSMPKPFFVVLMPDNLHCLWTHRNHVAHAHLNCNLLWEGHASWRQMNFYASELRHCRLHQGCLPALLLDELLFLLLWQNAWQKRLGRKGSFGVAIWRRSLLGGKSMVVREPLGFQLWQWDQKTTGPIVSTGSRRLRAPTATQLTFSIIFNWDSAGMGVTESQLIRCRNAFTDVPRGLSLTWL